MQDLSDDLPKAIRDQARKEAREGGSLRTIRARVDRATMAGAGHR